MNPEQFVALRVDVYARDEPSAVRAAETLTRAMLGLALDGISASLNVVRCEAADEESEEAE